VPDNNGAQVVCHFAKKFGQEDSVIIFELSQNCRITRMGYAKNTETDLLII
jgi:CRISPR-associated protein Cas2